MVREFPQYTGVYGTMETLKFYAKAEPQTESIAVTESYGRTIAEDVTSPMDVPLRDSSHMDGFAVRAEDVAAASESSPVMLRVLKGQGLRKIPRAILKNGEAYPILTGGYLPRGADTIVPIEGVQRAGKTLTILAPAPRGDYVYPSGTDVKAGANVVPKGTVLRAQEVGLLASLQVARVRVFRKPRVAILPTGSELTEKISHPERGKVIESHSHIIARLVEAAGGTPIGRAITPDDSKAIADALRSALKNGADIVLTVAGSSVGEPDLVDGAINSLGKPGIIVHGVRIHRGRVMGVAALSDKPIVIMPGPIQGALNAFIVFAYPLIRNLLGRSYEEPPTVMATLSRDWEASKRFQNFTKVVYVNLWTGPEGFVAEPIVGETEKMTLLTSTNAYLIVPETLTSLKKGSKVWTRLLPGFSYVGGRFL